MFVICTVSRGISTNESTVSPLILTNENRVLDSAWFDPRQVCLEGLEVENISNRENIWNEKILPTL